MNTHVSEDCMERYAMCRISSPRELADIEEHLLWCDVCSDRVHNQKAFVTTLRGLLKWYKDSDLEPPADLIIRLL